ncbi:hypothetical protein Tco_1509198 [Tanacetum coccineum]
MEAAGTIGMKARDSLTGIVAGKKGIEAKGSISSNLTTKKGMESNNIRRNLASKVKNIEGKAIRTDGTLRKAHREVHLENTNLELDPINVAVKNHIVDLNGAVTIEEPATNAIVSCFINKDNVTKVHEGIENETPAPKSFASMLKDKNLKKVIKLTKLTSNKIISGAHVAIPLVAVEEVSSRVLENGPWLIHLVPLILNVWTPNAKLKKDEITSIPIWVKLYNVPIVAYSEVGLSLITTQLGKPIMLDGYTSNMCVNSWGRNSYARALIEVSAKTMLLDSIVVAIPFPNDDDGFMEVKRKGGKGKQSIKPNVYRAINKSTNEKGKPSNTKATSTDFSQPKTNIDPLHKAGHISKQASNVDGSVWKENDIHGTVEDDDSKEVEENPDIMDVVVVSLEDQVIHTYILFKADKKELFCSFIYAHNRYQHRRILWNNLIHHMSYVYNRPWCLLGNFNASLHIDDKSVGSSYVDTAMRDFQDCIKAIEVADVNCSGLRFTWNQNPRGEDGVLKKIDRIMANLEFNELFVGSSALFQPYRTSDHSPAILRIPLNSVIKPRLFKFTNVLVHNPRFKEIVSIGNIIENVKRLRHELDEVQRALDADPHNVEIREEEAAYLQAFNDALIVEERFLKQKAKVEWLKSGDANSTYFHKVVKSHVSRNLIDSVTTSSGARVDGDQVPIAFIDHYMAFLGQLGVTIPLLNNNLFCTKHSTVVVDYMFHAVSDQEISWDIIAEDVIKALKEFFINGVLLKELNHMIITLIPKVDIQKAYDTVNWAFLKEVLIGFGFHPRMVGWIMECVTSTSYSMCINGNLHGYFKGKRGLRQGDPMSPYLFTLVMEVLTLMLHHRVRESDSFTYHRYYSDLNIINLCFVDDLFLFAHGDANLARVIMDSLEEFKNVSGLTPSLPKSTTYFCNVLNYVKLDILSILPFEEGKLLVKYLGVLLVSFRLIFRDCTELVEKVRERIRDCKNKFLSFAGRVQLIRSVLASMHVYWASVLILPSRIMMDLEQLMRGFLWCQGEMRKGKAKVAWEKILQVRPIVRQFIWYRLGDGSRTSAWFDKWCSLSPLTQIISNRDIYGAGLQLSSKVNEIIDHGNWVWPEHWYSKFPDLSTLNVPILDPNSMDGLIWKDHNDITSGFSMATVWEQVKTLIGIPNMPFTLDLITQFLILLAKKRSARRQSQLAYYTPNVVLMDRCGDSCSLKRFLPIVSLLVYLVLRFVACHLRLVDVQA